MQNPKLAAALEAAARGFRVFPVLPNSRRPAIDDWPALAATDPHQIESWWKADPDFNIGVATGNGMLVIDADAKKGKPGLRSLETLDVLGLPDSYRVATPSGGVHVYLHTDTQHRNRVNSIPDYPGIDIRAERGYVLGAGSTIDGKPYVEIGKPTSGSVPAPRWFDDLLATTTAGHVGREVTPLTELDLPQNVQRAKDWLVSRAPEAIEGSGGDHTTFSVAAELRAMAVSEHTALDLMLEHWNEQKASPPWQPDELAAKVQNAFAYGQGAPGYKTAAGEFGALDIDVGEPPRGVGKTDSVDSLEQREKPARLVRASDFAAQEKPERQFLVPDLVPHRNVTLLAGDGGTGKSLLAMQLAIATVAERRWIGQHVLLHGPVLYFSAEDDEDETHIRVKEICAADGLDVETLRDLHIALMAGEDAVLAVEHVKGAVVRRTPLFAKLRSWLANIRPALLVLDNLVDVFGGDQNTPALAKQFIGMIRGLAIEFDCAVVILSHPSLSGMSSGSGTAGTTAWSNSVRSRLYLRRCNEKDEVEIDPSRRILESKKANYAPTGTQIDVRWDRGRFVALDSLDMGDLDALDTNETKIERAERVFARMVRRFNSEGRTVSPSLGANYAPTVFSRHPDASGVNKSYLEMAMNNLFVKGVLAIEKSGPPSKQRQSIVFARGISNPLPTPFQPPTNGQ